jgi:hypothetical protein
MLQLQQWQKVVDFFFSFIFGVSGRRSRRTRQGCFFCQEFIVFFPPLSLNPLGKKNNQSIGYPIGHTGKQTFNQTQKATCITEMTTPEIHRCELLETVKESCVAMGFGDNGTWSNLVPHNSPPLPR